MSISMLDSARIRNLIKLIETRNLCSPKSRGSKWPSPTLGLRELLPKHHRNTIAAKALSKRGGSEAR